MNYITAPFTYLMSSVTGTAAPPPLEDAEDEIPPLEEAGGVYDEDPTVLASVNLLLGRRMYPGYHAYLASTITELVMYKLTQDGFQVISISGEAHRLTPRCITGDITQIDEEFRSGDEKKAKHVITELVSLIVYESLSKIHQSHAYTQSTAERRLAWLHGNQKRYPVLLQDMKVLPRDVVPRSAQVFTFTMWYGFQT